MPTATRFPSALVILITVALGMAFLLIIITIFVMRLYNKPKLSSAPNWMHSFVRKSRNLKLKLKCTARRRNLVQQDQDIENVEHGQPKDEIDNVEKSSPIKLYRNKEIAEFFDYFLFVVYTVLYILAISSILILAKIVYDYQTSRK
ncbi:Hypothetical predicted protein [Mytilus galloprovincialis]|nr:Hypothetical predicted protein [Mytilus galloprovincialis]